MRIESNLEQVILRAERRPREIHAGIERAMKPVKWIGLAKKTALDTLNAIADQQSRRLVPIFVERVIAIAMTNGFSFSLSARHVPEIAAFDVKGFRELATMTNQPLMRSAFFANRETARQVVADWVALEKDKDGRDTHNDGRPKSDEEITNGLMSILFGRKDFDPEKELAADELLKSEAEAGPHPGGGMRLIDFFAVHPLTSGLQGKQFSETIDTWLKAVLAAWGAMVRAEFPDRLRAELKATREELPIAA